MTAHHQEVTAGLITTKQELVVSCGCVEVTTDAVVTDGSVTAVDTVTLHTGLVTGVVVGLNSLLKCCSAIAGVANCFASLTVAFVLHDAPIKISLHMYCLSSIHTCVTMAGFQLLLNKNSSLAPKFVILVCHPRFSISMQQQKTSKCL